MKQFSKKTWVLLAGVVAALAFVASAAASVNFDPTCSLTPSNGTGACGFVGKGDVQTALGLNNAKMQAAAGSLKFTDTQSGTATFSQSATQTATQTTTTDTSCQDGNGNYHSYKIDSSSAVQTGSQTGSQTGTQDGTVGYTIDYDSRIHNQIDGFWLTGVTPTNFVGSGDLLWSGYTWSGYTWSGPVETTSYDPTESAWDACVANGTVSPDPVITVGPIVENAPVYGSVVQTGFSPSGPATLYVSSGGGNPIALN